MFLLPYQQFLGAHLRQEAEAEILSISFSSHQLTLEGRNLEEIVLALQEFAVGWIKPVPARFECLIDSGSATVANVAIIRTE